MANSRIASDPRIDPRIKAVFGSWDFPPQLDAASRDELLAEVNSAPALEAQKAFGPFMELCDTEDIAPSTGLCVGEYCFRSSPDGNTVKVRFIRPVGDERVPCVYYIHGGGMQSGSCYTDNYRAWGRMIATHGVGVAMVDFRNALIPSSVPEVARIRRA